MHAIPNLKEVFKWMTTGKDSVVTEALEPQMPPFGTKAEIAKSQIGGIEPNIPGLDDWYKKDYTCVFILQLIFCMYVDRTTAVIKHKK